MIVFLLLVIIILMMFGPYPILMLIKAAFWLVVGLISLFAALLVYQTVT